jgi:(p)ppGpp synthase/HD superfamily hydrolase
MSDLIAAAQTFAIAAHGSIKHRRKYTGEPYHVHLAAVAELVSTVPHSDEMIAAAWLHDVLENVPSVKYGRLQVQFGSEVANLVSWLTDVSRPEDGNRAVRKKIDRDRLAQAPAEAQTIKVADLIDNTKSITVHDSAFARVYLQEKKALLEVLTKADAQLLEIACKQVW